MKLSMRCRGGRNELVVAGPGVPGRGDDYAISYRVNDSQGLQIAAAVPTSEIGVAFGGDVVRLLQSLPDGGSLSVHLTSRMGTALDAVFSLGGLEAVRAKMTTVCRWPHPAAKPNIARVTTIGAVTVLFAASFAAAEQGGQYWVPTTTDPATYHPRIAAKAATTDKATTTQKRERSPLATNVRLASDSKAHRLVLQVNTNEPASMNLALNNATNVAQY